MANIWDVLDDSVSYVKSKDANLKKVETIEKDMLTLLKIQERRVAFNDFVLQRIRQTVSLTNSPKLRQLWVTTQKKHKQQEATVLQKIRKQLRK